MKFCCCRRLVVGQRQGEFLVRIFISVRGPIYFQVEKVNNHTIYTEYIYISIYLYMIYMSCHLKELSSDLFIDTHQVYFAYFRKEIKILLSLNSIKSMKMQHVMNISKILSLFHVFFRDKPAFYILDYR